MGEKSCMLRECLPKECLPRAGIEKRNKYKIEASGVEKEVVGYEPGRWPTPKTFIVINLDKKLWGRYEAKLHVELGEK